MKRRRYQIVSLAAAAGFGALLMALPSSGSGVDVTLTDRLRFQPETIRVDTGGAVTFTNSSQLTHTATCQGCSGDTGDIQPETFKTLTFTRPGSYVLFCRYHGQQGMIATLIVGSAGSSPAPAPSPTATSTVPQPAVTPTG